MIQIEPRLLKGFRDYAPKEQLIRQGMLHKIQNTFERFGFLPMATPVLEYKDILTGKYGEDEKLIYSFKDNGERDVAMRYDLTVPFARFVAMNQNNLTLPFKRYQMGPVWRADNPQKGRLREFVQCDIDVVGADSLLADVDVVSCVATALNEIGIPDYEIRIGSRKILNTLNTVLGLENNTQALEIIRAIDKVKKIGNEGVLDVLKQQNIPDATLKQVEQFLNIGQGDEALATLKTVFGGALEDEARATEGFIQLLIEQGVSPDRIIFDPSIARGLDYYTGFVFEITLAGAPEYGSVGAGGRYDNLLSQFSSQLLPAVGISIGLDRLFGALEANGRLVPVKPVQAIVFNIDSSVQSEYLRIVTRLREGGINTELYYQTTKLDKQFKYAEIQGIRYAVIMGGDEMAQRTVQVKNLETREQQVVPIDQIAEYIKK